jgi:addiction module RelE/StbE family toxin
MVTVVLTKQARQDLKEIKNYISLSSPMNAERVGDKIISEIQTLITHPHRGRIIIKTSHQSIRQILVFKYRIFYRELSDKIQVLSIYHGARSIENNPGLQSYFED